MSDEPSNQDRLWIQQRVLEPQRRLLTVTLSDGAIFEMAPDAPEAADLESGDPVDPAQLAALHQAATRRQVAREVFRLLDRRAFTRAQLTERLLAKGFEPEAIEPVLEESQRQGLIDDGAFARAYCRDQLRRKPVGRSWLRQRLRQAGVDEAEVEQALDEVLRAGDEVDRARQALGGRSKDLSDENGKARAFRFLVSRGFSESVARRTVFDLAARRSAAGKSGVDDAE